MIDREQVAEALALLNDETYMVLASASEPIRIAIEAARAWLDQGDALVIRENDELPQIVGVISTRPQFEKVETPLLLKFAYALVDALSDRSDKP